MPEPKRKYAPIRQSVHVDCPIEDAFRLFIDGFAEWWPLAAYSISGEQAASCAIEPWEGGRIFERTRSGEERDWGSVTAWDRPRRLEFSWHREQTVEIEFAVEADGTRVTLIHHGWESAGVETCLSRFAKFASAQMLTAC
jgi:Activator of Hsp90 ATPase homolog 1-like protein